MHDDKMRTTEGLVKDYITNGSNDGVIIRNVDDYAENQMRTYDTSFAVKDSNQIKSATDNNGEFSKENNNINFQIDSRWTDDLTPNDKLSNALIDLINKTENLQVTLVDEEQIGEIVGNGDAEFASKPRKIFNSDLTKDEINTIQNHIESLDENTDTSNGLYLHSGNYIYKFNTSLKQYADNRRDGHDGFEIIGKYDISKLNKEQLNRFENEYRKNRGNINRTIAQLGLSKRSINGGIVVIDYGEGYENYDTMDSQSPASNRGQGNRDSRSNQRTSEVEGNVDYMRLPNGTVYGFTKDGMIYLLKDRVNPNTVIHEYTHLWAEAVMKGNPQLWQNIKDYLNRSDVAKALAQTVLSQEEYSYLKNNKDRLTSEVLARLSGRANREKLEKAIAESKGTTKSILQKVKDLIEKFWKWVGVNLFDIKEFSSINEITDRILYDLLNQTNLYNFGGFVNSSNNINFQIERTLQSQQQLNFNIISDKIVAFGVELNKGGAKTMQSEAKVWQQTNPNGIVAYRKYKDTPKTFTKETVDEGWIGNPFSVESKGHDTVQQFGEWLVSGNNFGEERANEEYRQAIIKRILSTPTDAKILYYSELYSSETIFH